MKSDALVLLVTATYLAVIALLVVAARRLEAHSHAVARAERWEHLTHLRWQLVEEEERQLDSKGAVR